MTTSIPPITADGLVKKLRDELFTAALVLGRASPGPWKGLAAASYDAARREDHRRTLILYSQALTLREPARECLISQGVTLGGVRIV